MSIKLDVHADEHDALVLVDPSTGEELHLRAKEVEYILAALLLTNRRYSLPAHSGRPIRDVNTDVWHWLDRRGVKISGIARGD